MLDFWTRKVKWMPCVADKGKNREEQRERQRGGEKGDVEEGKCLLLHYAQRKAVHLFCTITESVVQNENVT